MAAYMNSDWWLDQRQTENNVFLFWLCYKRNGKRCSCATMELWMHLGGLLSTQEARVALGNSYASFVLSNLPHASITPWLHAARLPFLNWDTWATKPLGFYSSFFLNVSRHQTPCLHVHLNAFFKGNRNPTNINILDFEVTYNLWNDLNPTKTWLRFKHKRSPAAVKLEELLLSKNVLHDASMLSPKYQTSVLETKHSLDIHFIPKNTGFLVLGHVHKVT